MFKSKILVCLMLIIINVFSLSTVAQSNVAITKYDGSTQDVVVSEAGKLYFTEEEMYINDGNGNTLDFLISDIAKLEITPKVGIKTFDSNNVNTLKVFPNPSSSKITVVFNSANASDVDIYSISGRLMAKQEMLSGSKIDISFLPLGFYFIKVNNQTAKFVML